MSNHLGDLGEAQITTIGMCSARITLGILRRVNPRIIYDVMALQWKFYIVAGANIVREWPADGREATGAVPTVSSI